MADDIFLSPEEQDERAKQWLKDNGPAIVIGIALGIGAIFGFNSYKDGIQKKSEQASALFSTTLEKINESELIDIQAQVSELKGKYSDSSYAAKAALLNASQLAKTDIDAAYTELQWVVDNAPENGLVHTAKIRQAKIKLAGGDLDAARSLASPASYDGFDSHYNEILGDIEVKAGNLEVARTYYEAAADGLSESDFSYRQLLSIKIDRLPAKSSETDSQ